MTECVWPVWGGEPHLSSFLPRVCARADESKRTKRKFFKIISGDINFLLDLRLKCVVHDVFKPEIQVRSVNDPGWVTCGRVGECHGQVFRADPVGAARRLW